MNGKGGGGGAGRPRGGGKERCAPREGVARGGREEGEQGGGGHSVGVARVVQGDRCGRYFSTRERSEGGRGRGLLAEGVPVTLPPLPSRLLQRLAPWTPLAPKIGGEGEAGGAEEEQEGRDGKRWRPVIVTRAPRQRSGHGAHVSAAPTAPGWRRREPESRGATEVAADDGSCESRDFRLDATTDRRLLESTRMYSTVKQRDLIGGTCGGGGLLPSTSPPPSMTPLHASPAPVPDRDGDLPPALRCVAVASSSAHRWSWRLRWLHGHVPLPRRSRSAPCPLTTCRSVVCGVG